MQRSIIKTHYGRKSCIHQVVELCPNMSVPTKTSVSDLRFKPAGGSHISYCNNLSKLHDFTLHACWCKLNFLLYMHSLLVEGTFLTVHVGD